MQEQNPNITEKEADFRCGSIALVGRPSSGKSTLINILCGEKVAIVSPKPQTTRNVIRGVVHRSTCQLIFLDTPGFSEIKDCLTEQLRNELRVTLLKDAHIVLYLIDLSRPTRNNILHKDKYYHNQYLEKNDITDCEWGEERGLLALLKNSLIKRPRPLIIAMNKCDVLAEQRLQQQRIEEYLQLFQEYFPQIQEKYKQFFVISAKKKEGLEELVQCLSSQLPVGQPRYSEQVYTDQEPVFRVQELIREQVLPFCGQELPYAVYVEVNDLEYRCWDESKGKSIESQNSSLGMWIRAFVRVEQNSQKGILIGKGGERIREIRKRSTRAIRRGFGCPVYLDLQVKVDPKWRRRQH